MNRRDRMRAERARAQRPAHIRAFKAYETLWVLRQVRAKLAAASLFRDVADACTRLAKGEELKDILLSVSPDVERRLLSTPPLRRQRPLFLDLAAKASNEARETIRNIKRGPS